MKFLETCINGVWLIQPSIYVDDRGYFFESFSDKEFKDIVVSSGSMIEVAKKLGYTSHSGSNGERIRHRIDELQISTEHFSLSNRRPIKRSPENVFIENSTAD